MDPEGGDAVVEVLMEELMQLHSCYSKERCCDCAEAACEENRGGPMLASAPTEEACGWFDGKTFSFGCALEKVKHGARIARQGWNSKNQYVFLVRKLEFYTDADLSEWEGKRTLVHPALAIKTTVGQIQVGWLASQADMLSEDWYEVK